MGRHEDPKIWKGTWVSVTSPEEIAKHICDMNIKQYNQDWATPFGSGPLAETLGRNGDTLAAEALLAGNLPTQVLSSLMPETIRIFKTLSTPQITLPEDHKVVISEEEFISTFKEIEEATSSSPSGLHVGH